MEHLTSIDIDDCSECSQLIPIGHLFTLVMTTLNFIDKQIKKNLDLLYIDSYHEPAHVEKVFYHYYDFFKR